ncbi:response regulator [Fischerella sp. JS2]|uniref:response regulator n=1 Tax=Fischerella sp. JS2 TaxID=2597771 RepID=UPI0028E36350|nr:response regulator [Fischerella sp. JS2]
MSGKLILLIDHEASVRTILQVCLSRLGGWNVLSVSSLSQGLEVLMLKEALLLKRPDVILLDMPMLATDGLGVMQEFRNHPLIQPIPIVLITAKASWFSDQQLKHMRIVGAIAKPFNPIKLPKQITDILNWES